jgi:hypothetical protein
VRKFAQPFVDWLRSAEAESEEEEWSNQLACFACLFVQEMW